MMRSPALGLIETKSLKGALKALRDATAAGHVAIASATRTEQGRVVVKIEGDHAAVQKAAEAGALAADVDNELISIHIIPRTESDLSEIMPYDRFLSEFSPEHPTRKQKPPSRKQTRQSMQEETAPPSPTKPAPVKETPPFVEKEPELALPKHQKDSSSQTELSLDQLQALSVVRLRQYARAMPELPIQGRQISMANKQQLLEAIKNVSTAPSDGV